MLGVSDSDSIRVSVKCSVLVLVTSGRVSAGVRASVGARASVNDSVSARVRVSVLVVSVRVQCGNIVSMLTVVLVSVLVLVVELIVSLSVSVSDGTDCRAKVSVMSSVRASPP